jgi:hypothetical protein
MNELGDFREAWGLDEFLGLGGFALSFDGVGNPSPKVGTWGTRFSCESLQPDLGEQLCDLTGRRSESPLLRYKTQPQRTQSYGQACD